MRIASLIYRRGYNIESLSVGRTDVPGLSRFTVIIEGEEGVYDQIRKQLMKLIEVIEVQNLTKDGPFVERWLSLVKVMAAGPAQAAHPSDGGDISLPRGGPRLRRYHA